MSVGIGVCSLNQFALDFDGNCRRIIESIKQVKSLGGTLRVGPELEVTGYGCEDAFYEVDTVFHSWQVLAEVLKQSFEGILIDVGMPLIRNGALYNCRIIVLNSKIVMIRPKTKLALNGNYRESRWFTAWNEYNEKPTMVWYQLPELITEITGQTFVPFGDGAILEIPRAGNLFSSPTIKIGFEICEELWRMNAQHIDLFGKRGCDIIFNSSASYWEIRKLNRAFSLMASTTFKAGGCYAYANLVGCDGGRLCYYGRSLVMLNGSPVVMTTDKDDLFDEVQTRVAFIDPNDIAQYRLSANIRFDGYHDVGDTLVFDAQKGFAETSNKSILNLTSISLAGFKIMQDSCNAATTRKIEQPILAAEQEIMWYGSLWLWDYLRRCSGIRGFIVPLSGGLDSSSVACLVFCLCSLLKYQISKGNDFVLNQLKSIFKTDDLTNCSDRDLCYYMLKGVYLKTRFSGAQSEKRATKLAKVLNANFSIYDFDHLYKDITEKIPSAEKSEGISLQMQNVQARLRMILTYFMSEGKRLVLATGNVDEALVGYLTKYDCSSADLNPIGSISKHDIHNFVHYCKEIIGYEHHEILASILEAIPSAELTGEEQKDEDDLGLTYAELSKFGKLRRGQDGVYGPYGMFCKIWEERHNPQFWDIRGLKDNKNPDDIAAKVKRFFSLYAKNRHKTTVLTPALHTETYSPDDNRFDHRQILFDTTWKWQFAQIDKKVAEIKSDKHQH